MGNFITRYRRVDAIIALIVSLNKPTPYRVTKEGERFEVIPRDDLTESTVTQGEVRVRECVSYTRPMKVKLDRCNGDRKGDLSCWWKGKAIVRGYKFLFENSDRILPSDTIPPRPLLSSRTLPLSVRLLGLGQARSRRHLVLRAENRDEDDRFADLWERSLGR